MRPDDDAAADDCRCSSLMSYSHRRCHMSVICDNGRKLAPLIPPCRSPRAGTRITTRRMPRGRWPRLCERVSGTSNAHSPNDCPHVPQNGFPRTAHGIAGSRHRQRIYGDHGQGYDGVQAVSHVGLWRFALGSCVRSSAQRCHLPSDHPLPGPTCDSRRQIAERTTWRAATTATATPAALRHVYNRMLGQL